MFPWEVNRERVTQFYTGPYLFSALFRAYKGAYFGQGFQLTGNLPKLSKDFQILFDKLPLEVKGIILSKIWEEGRNYNIFIIDKGELLLPLKLQFLFAQYGRIKHLTQSLIPKGCGAWNGSLASPNRSRRYVFKYGVPNLKSKVLIPDFLNSERGKPLAIHYGLLCP